VAAAKLAQELGPGKTIVTILCDSGKCGKSCRVWIIDRITGTRHLSKFWTEIGTIGNKNDLNIEEVLNATS
jgi:hypothetical protein